MTLLFLLALVVGIAVLVGAAELLVRGASRLAVTAGISPLVVGLTVVAYGTSAPELFVSVTAVWWPAEVREPAAEATPAEESAARHGVDDLAVGNVVGSNISNILLVLGLAAVIAPLEVSKGVVRLSVPAMIGFSCLPLLMGWDGVLGRIDGGVLAILAVIYTIQAIWRSRRDTALARQAEEEVGDTQPATSTGAVLRQFGYIGVGIVLMGLGAWALIFGATGIARSLGVGELVIGLTVVAIGTSLPEVATTVVAAIRGERDIAVGNAVGSNIFNVLLVLGCTALASPDGVTVSPSARYFDLPVMISVAVACLPVFFNGYSIKRWEGVFFLLYYVGYVAYLFLKEAEHEHLRTFELVFLYGVLPLTLVTLGVFTFQTVRRGRRSE